MDPADDEAQDTVMGRRAPIGNTVIGQRVAPEKTERARELRRRMTPAEAALWRRLKTNQLGGLHFRRQQVIAGFIADFYCHAAALVVSVDGEIHAGMVEHDAERDAALTGRGFRVIHVSNEAVLNDLEGTLRRLEEACRAT
jgi:very-short-patch-repair endonuclease